MVQRSMRRALGLGPGAFPAVHHLNLAHGLMVQAVRAELGERTKCSVTLNLALNRGDADAAIVSI